jgi:DNA polymerase III sliding clamp (beta) subunit (PCNA family)
MQRSDLVKLLELVAPALSDTNLVPVYSCFMFKPKTISAYNDMIGIVAKGGVGPEPFAVTGKIILELLQNSRAAEATLQLTADDVVVKTGKSTARLPFFTEKDFLFDEPDEQWAGTVVINDEVIKGIETCLTTSSKDRTQEAFMGVCFNFNIGKHLHLFSCDGDAITKYVTDGPATGKGAYTAPNEFCEALLKICHDTDTVTGKLTINGNWAKATVDSGFVVYGRIIDNSNPLDHMKLINQSLNGDPTFVTMPLGLHDALARARVLADIENGKTIMTVTGGNLNLYTNTHMGDVKDDMKCKGHPDTKATVHASLVQRSLAYCNEISISDRVTAYRDGDVILQIVSNIGE